MKRKKALLHIHPQWVPLRLWLGTTALCLFYIFRTENTGTPYAALLVSSFCLFQHSISLSVYEDRLVQRVAGFPARTIRREELRGVIYRQAHAGYRGRRVPPTLLLLSAPDTLESISAQLNETGARIPRSVVQVLLSDRQEPEALAILQEHFGPVTDFEEVYFHDYGAYDSF